MAKNIKIDVGLATQAIPLHNTRLLVMVESIKESSWWEKQQIGKGRNKSRIQAEALDQQCSRHIYDLWPLNH